MAWQNSGIFRINDGYRDYQGFTSYVAPLAMKCHEARFDNEQISWE
jgi:hypothetical protein